MQDWIKMSKDGEEKLVHPGNVANHIRADWSIVDDAVVPVAVETVESAEPVAITPDDAAFVGARPIDKDVVEEPERAAALERFARMLESARKKPAGGASKIFAQLGVEIADPPGPAEPWPPHVLMARTIDALVATAPESRKLLVLGLFGKSAPYADGLIEARSKEA